MAAAEEALLLFGENTIRTQTEEETRGVFINVVVFPFIAWQRKVRTHIEIQMRREHAFPTFLPYFTYTRTPDFPERGGLIVSDVRTKVDSFKRVSCRVVSW